MTEEVWKPISGFEGLYEVSNFGSIRRIDCDPYRYLKFGYAGRGYSQVHLYGLLGKKRDAYVHRLVAEAFLENPRNCEQVNHIDGNKKNNHVSNLEWCTNRENNAHAWGTGIRYVKKILCVETGEIFSNARIASDAHHCHPSAITAVCLGYYGHRTAGGFHWKYTDEVEK